MATLESTALEIVDGLADVVTGPVRGAVNATASVAGTEIFAGQMGTLPDGRRVRALESKAIAATPTAVRVRLEWLSPAYPAAANFAAVADGLVVTWVDPPAGINATGATSGAFGHGLFAANRYVGSAVDYDRIRGEFDVFAAGANGTTALILLDPELTPIGGEHNFGRQYFDLKWTLRINVSTFEPKKDARALLRSAFDGVTKAILGKEAGDATIRFGSFKPVAKSHLAQSWDLQLFTQIALEGRAYQDEANDDVDLEGIDATIKLPRDADQPGPFRVEDEIDV